MTLTDGEHTGPKAMEHTKADQVIQTDGCRCLLRYYALRPHRIGDPRDVIVRFCWLPRRVFHLQVWWPVYVECEGGDSSTEASHVLLNGKIDLIKPRRPKGSTRVRPQLFADTNGDKDDEEE